MIISIPNGSKTGSNCCTDISSTHGNDYRHGEEQQCQTATTLEKDNITLDVSSFSFSSSLGEDDEKEVLTTPTTSPSPLVISSSDPFLTDDIVTYFDNNLPLKTRTKSSNSRIVPSIVSSCSQTSIIMSGSANNNLNNNNNKTTTRNTTEIEMLVDEQEQPSKDNTSLLVTTHHQDHTREWGDIPAASISALSSTGVDQSHDSIIYHNHNHHPYAFDGSTMMPPLCESLSTSDFPSTNVGGNKKLEESTASATTTTSGVHFFNEPHERATTSTNDLTEFERILLHDHFQKCLKLYFDVKRLLQQQQRQEQQQEERSNLRNDDRTSIMKKPRTEKKESLKDQKQAGAEGASSLLADEGKTCQDDNNDMTTSSSSPNTTSSSENDVLALELPMKDEERNELYHEILCCYFGYHPPPSPPSSHTSTLATKDFLHEALYLLSWKQKNLVKTMEQERTRRDDDQNGKDVVETTTMRMTTKRLKPLATNKKKPPISVKFNKRQTDILIHWMIEHKSYPYPTKGEIQELCQETGLIYQQVVDWTTNIRKRKKKAMLKGIKRQRDFLDFLFLAQDRDDKKNSQVEEEEDENEDSKEVVLQPANAKDHGTTKRRHPKQLEEATSSSVPPKKKKRSKSNPVAAERKKATTNVLVADETKELKMHDSMKNEKPPSLSTTTAQLPIQQRESSPPSSLIRSFDQTFDAPTAHENSKEKFYDSSRMGAAKPLSSGEDQQEQSAMGGEPTQYAEI